MTEAQNVALVRRAITEIWNRGDLDVADELVAADYVNHAGLIPDLVRGPEAMKLSVALYRSAFPDLQISLDTLTATQDIVLFRWTAHHTSIVGDTTSSVRGTLTGGMVIRVVDGQIAESWADWDQARVLEQLGLAGCHLPGFSDGGCVRP